ncbi:DUF3224 domain-containing protein, partial [Kitasatospora purpeofusca]|uniref:DUF3224 domain-containing protein n=1 Tax=Kitasatospora purpeofusca TaxID=67352 RepID=UPI0033C7B273
MMPRAAAPEPRRPALHPHATRTLQYGRGPGAEHGCSYEAVERFTGELDGRQGSFVLQHSAPG